MLMLLAGALGRAALQPCSLFPSISHLCLLTHHSENSPTALRSRLPVSPVPPNHTPEAVWCQVYQRTSSFLVIRIFSHIRVLLMERVDPPPISLLALQSSLEYPNLDLSLLVSWNVFWTEERWHWNWVQSAMGWEGGEGIQILLCIGSDF